MLPVYMDCRVRARVYDFLKCFSCLLFVFYCAGEVLASFDVNMPM
jgi:hypothetical protein